MASLPSKSVKFVVLVIYAIMPLPTVALRQPVQNVPTQVFSPGSFWYKPLPPDAPIHPNSRQFVSEFLRQKRSYYGTGSINTVTYGSPVYVADETTQGVVVRLWDCQKRGHIDQSLAEQW